MKATRPLVAGGTVKLSPRIAPASPVRNQERGELRDPETAEAMAAALGAELAEPKDVLVCVPRELLPDTVPPWSACRVEGTRFYVTVARPVVLDAEALVYLNVFEMTKSKRTPIHGTLYEVVLRRQGNAWQAVDVRFVGTT